MYSRPCPSCKQPCSMVPYLAPLSSIKYQKFICSLQNPMELLVHYLLKVNCNSFPYCYLHYSKVNCNSFPYFYELFLDLHLFLVMNDFFDKAFQLWYHSQVTHFFDLQLNLLLVRDVNMWNILKGKIDTHLVFLLLPPLDSQILVFLVKKPSKHYRWQPFFLSSHWTPLVWLSLLNTLSFINRCVSDQIQILKSLIDPPELVANTESACSRICQVYKQTASFLQTVVGLCYKDRISQKSNDC